MLATKIFIPLLFALLASAQVLKIHEKKHHSISKRSHDHGVGKKMNKRTTGSSSKRSNHSKKSLASSKKGKNAKRANKGHGHTSKRWHGHASSLHPRGTSFPGNDLLRIRGVPLGLLPDDTSQGGRMQTLSEDDLAGGVRFSTFGRFSQVVGGTPYDGAQLLSVLGDLVASRAILEAALEPRGSYEGLTESDNSQAVNVCTVLQGIASQGVQIRLRWAPEANYYLNDADYNGTGVNTYPGTAADVQESFQVIVKTCRQIAPSVKHIWSVNYTPDITELAPLFPGDKNIDYVAMDYYPSAPANLTQYTNIIGPFYKRYATRRHPYLQTETGLKYNGSIHDKLFWLDSIIKAARGKFPLLQGITWFNFDNTATPDDFRIVDSLDKPLTQAFMNYVRTGRIPKN